MSKAKITVIGAGLMGHGIAQVFAAAGHDVTITDSVKQSLDTAKTRIAANLRDLGDDEKAVDNVHVCADLAEAVRDADYVVEAVLEDLPLKQKLFAEIERHVRPDTILASNTSVIPITAIVQEVRNRLPKAEILLLGVFPRGAKPNANRDKLDHVNAKIAKLDDGSRVKYLDIGKAFLNEDGTISREVMPDYLHLSQKGYRIWAEAMEPTLWSMLDNPGDSALRRYSPSGTGPIE